ncbi:MAG: hypothetical protein HYS27_11830 [Deltaproteobacteria bacterium]|nr:hypothetical protein [Deltaproteobacteria bacterium]
MTLLEVPRPHLQPLQRLLALDRAARSAFVSALQTARATTDLDAFVASIPTDAFAATAEDIAPLASLYLGRDRSGTSAADYAVSIVEALKRAEMQPTGGDWDALTADLVKVLEAHDSLGLTAKGWELSEEHDRVFCNARIMTDLRPIFTLKTDKKIRGAVITHTMRITFHDEDSRSTSDVLVGMRASDLVKLRSAIERAIEKEAVLRDAVSNTITIVGGDDRV